MTLKVKSKSNSFCVIAPEGLEDQNIHPGGISTRSSQNDANKHRLGFFIFSHFEETLRGQVAAVKSYMYD